MIAQPEISSSEAYHFFLAAAKKVETIIRSRPDVTDANIGLGYRYLAGMWIFHLERAFKSYDIDNPCFVRDMDGFRTWGFPSPDHHYYSAQIRGNTPYQIRGNRGEAVDFCLEVLTGLVGDDGEIGERIAALEEKNLVCDENGNFEIYVGGPEREQNWMPSRQDARCIFVRQTIDQWRNVRAEPLVIECLACPSSPERSYNVDTIDDVSRCYRQAAKNLLDQVRFLNDFSLQWKNLLPVNSLAAPAVGPADAGYFPGQFNTKCQFALTPGKALMITLPPSSAKYEGLALAHPQWFNSIDPRHVQSSLNRTQAKVSNDGCYRYVISASDPHLQNWLDTAGLLNGFLFIRYQQADPSAPPGPPHIERYSLEELRAAFPDEYIEDTRPIRLKALAERRKGLDQRHF